jgi:hypothetical protein
MEPRSRHSAAALALLVLCACTPGPDDGVVCRAYAHGQSRVEVIADGNVVRLLGTHVGPSGPHEGFLLRLRRGCALTVRVESSIDFTGPIPLRAGDAVVVKGEYEYDAFGGVIHFTHRELYGRHAGGYVELHGTYYW